MKSQRSSGKPKRLKIVALRQVAGYSMAPAYAPGALLVLTGWFRDVRIDEVVVFMHHGKEKIKRIKQIDPLKGLFVVGDNPDSSTDSRTFGWIDFDEVVAKVIWPFRS